MDSPKEYAINTKNAVLSDAYIVWVVRLIKPVAALACKMFGGLPETPSKNHVLP